MLQRQANAAGARVSSLTVAEAAIQKRELKSEGSGTDATRIYATLSCFEVRALYTIELEIANGEHIGLQCETTNSFIDTRQCMRSSSGG
jgi:hypothetical protein